MMKKGLLCFLVLFAGMVQTLILNNTMQAALLPNIVRLDKRFDSIVAQNAILEKLADGFGWVEGPVWNRSRNYLLFSDVANNQIKRWQSSVVTVFLKRSGYTGEKAFTGTEPGSNGLSFDAEGRLVFCQHGDRKISRLEKDGSRTTLVERFQEKRLNSPNDLIFHSNGDLYFTDPPFGLPKSFEDTGKELDFQGVYRYSKDGKLDLVEKDLKGPNGIAFSPDEKKLYVSDPIEGYWFVFDVKSDGSVQNKKVFLDSRNLSKNGPGGPDGLKVDQSGNIFGAGPGGLYVISSDGSILGRFDFGVPIGNCAWGEDGSTLFITANTALYRIRLNTKGIGF